MIRIPIAAMRSVRICIQFLAIGNDPDELTGSPARAISGREWSAHRLREPRQGARCTATGPSTPTPQGLRPGVSAPAAGAVINHLKTAATVISVTSLCTVLVTIAGAVGTLAPFTGKEITLRATTRTFYADGQAGATTRLGTLGLKPDDVLTLSFDSRPSLRAATR